MANQAMPPKRIADYFFIVGLKDDYPLTDDADVLPDECNSEETPVDRPIHLSDSLSPSPVHSSQFDGNTTTKNPNVAFLPTIAPTTETTTSGGQTISKGRARSQSMAQSGPLVSRTANSLLPPLAPARQGKDASGKMDRHRTKSPFLLLTTHPRPPLSTEPWNSASNKHHLQQLPSQVYRREQCE